VLSLACPVSTTMHQGAPLLVRSVEAVTLAVECSCRPVPRLRGAPSASPPPPG